jgi:nucleoside 2-deoxyribosyltransferase
MGKMSNEVSCKICGRGSVFAKSMGNRDVTIYGCPVCGEYGLSIQALMDLGTMFNEDKAKLSTFLRQRHIRQDKMITVISKPMEPTSTDIPVTSIDEIVHNWFPSTVSDRLDHALKNLYRNQQAFQFILDALMQAGWITGQGGPVTPLVKLTANGWNRIAELESNKPGADSIQAFVAMSFEGSLDSAYQNGIKKAIEAADYKAIRIDLKEHNEKICDSIGAEIRKSRFMVADFTGHRAGVYFEAGYALGLGIPVIWTCREDELANTHFDTRQYNHIDWKNELDLFERLKHRIEATI